MRWIRRLLTEFFSLRQTITLASPEVEQADAPAIQPATPLPIRIERDTIAGDNVEYRRSPNTTGPMVHSPSHIIIHNTATLTAASPLAVLTDPDEQKSCHVVIDRAGKYYTLMPFTRIAWHAGKSEWDGKTSLNRFSIGIELVNAGLLTLTDGGIKTWYGHLVPSYEVEKRGGRLWHSYAPEQIDACTTLCKLLADHYPIRHILGHEEVSPGRKIDPGPAYPLDELRAAVQQSRRVA